MLNLLSPLAPTGLTFQLEHFLGQLFSLFDGLGEVITEAGFLLGGCMGRRQSCQRRLAFAQDGDSIQAFLLCYRVF